MLRAIHNRGLRGQSGANSRQVNRSTTPISKSFSFCGFVLHIDLHIPHPLKVPQFQQIRLNFTYRFYFLQMQKVGGTPQRRKTALTRHLPLVIRARSLGGDPDSRSLGPDSIGTPHYFSIPCGMNACLASRAKPFIMNGCIEQGEGVPPALLTTSQSITRRSLLDTVHVELTLFSAGRQ